MAMNAMFLAFILISVILILACMVCVCLWIHRDARSRGQSGLVWIIIVLFSSPVIGLLAYLLAGRRETRVPCQGCGWMIPRDARFCERCGTEQPPLPDTPPEKKSRAGLLIAAIVTFVLSIGCVLSFAVTSIVGASSGSGLSYPSPTVNVMSVNTMFGGEWKVSCYYSSNGYLKRNFTLDSPEQVLNANVTCEEGRVFLHVHQGDTKVIYDLTETQGEFRLPMEEFQPGKIRVMIEVQDIRELKSLIFLE